MEQLVQDTIIFLRMAANDKETPEIVRSTAKNLLNSWELQEKIAANEK